MKPPIFFAASLALNLTLVGAIVYLLESRATTAPVGSAIVSAQDFASAPVNTSTNDEPAMSVTSPVASNFPASQPRSESIPAIDNRPQIAITKTSSPAPIFPAVATIPPSSATASHPQPIAQGSSPQPAGDSDLADGQPVNANSPGNSLNFRGIRVAVAESYPGGAAGAALGVDVTPASASEPDLAEAIAGNGVSNPGNFSDGTSNAVTTSRDHSSPKVGGKPNTTTTNPSIIPTQSSDLTHEDELFIMKWGFAAFDAARTEARREAQRQQLGK